MGQKISIKVKMLNWWLKHTKNKKTKKKNKKQKTKKQNKTTRALSNTAQKSTQCNVTYMVFFFFFWGENIYSCFKSMRTIIIIYKYTNYIYNLGMVGR